MKNKILFSSIGAMLASVSLAAFAQAPAGPVKPTYEIPLTDARNEDGADQGPRGITIADGVAIYPYVNFSVGRDDNLFLTNRNQTSSTFYTLAPGFRFRTRSQSVIFTLDASSKSTRYAQSRADDYSDYRLAGTGEFIFSSRSALRIGAEYNRGHDARGSTDRGIQSEPDLYRNSGGGALFAFGGNEARGRFELEAGSYQKRYTNNRATTFVSDRDNDSFAGRIFFRVAPKTSFLVEAREDKYDYTSPISLFDSKERRYLGGVTWEATAATSGTIKIGQLRKDFGSSSRKDYSATGWDAIVQWAPRTYSRLNFFAVKEFGESTGVGDFILRKRYGASWRHDWNSRLATTANIDRGYDDFINGGRNDVTDNIGFRISYRVQRWLTIGGEFTNTDRDSNFATSRYKRNIYAFTLGATL